MLIKKHPVVTLFSLGLILFSFAAKAQQIDPSFLEKRWSAMWIAVPDESPDDYGVYLFRKKLDIAGAPKNYVIHVSADNRYKLFVNGQLVSMGPARGDLSHWNFETLDIAPFLKSGQNLITAQVWNEGKWKPEAQITFRTGFIIQGATDTEINTNDSWKCQRDNSYAPLQFNVRAYYVAGAGEIRNMAVHPKGWQTPDYDDSQWQNAQVLFPGMPKNVLGPFGTPLGWMLKPSEIPQMELREERLEKLVRVQGDVAIPGGFPKRKAAFTVPANTSISLLLDRGYLTNAYTNLTFSGGKEATVAIGYAEALYTEFPNKGNRNETEGKTFLGRTDSLIADGSANQQFTSLTYRTYRYVQLRIVTQNEPLTINDFFGTFTGYPFEFKATYNTKNEKIPQLLDIGWRTARLCAAEIYMDCPYYEQLQYIGDTRIQALVSLYNSGDDRLVKNAINLMDYSRQPEGVTLSRHPSYTPQYIPTFSLWYIGMLHDYSRYGPDLDFIKGRVSGTRQILEYFHHYEQADGSLKNVPQWMFTDWVEFENWRAGIGPMSDDGTSGILDLQLLLAYQTAAELETQLGMPEMATVYQKRIEQLKATIRAKYWDEDRQLFADRQEKDAFSQHTNTLAILTGLVKGEQALALARQLLNNTDLAPASIYFKYYLHRALIASGLGDDYFDWLEKWDENIAMGLTTWAEKSEVGDSRSDCHAWGSSPNIEFYRTVLGIDSDGLGFSKVKIQPHLGNITSISGSIPHPRGTLSVDYQLTNNQWTVKIELPESVTGSFIWGNQKFVLNAGKNEWTFK